MTRARRHIPPTTRFECELPFWRPEVQHEDPVCCQYCGTSMTAYFEPGLWELQFDDFAAAYSAAIRDKSFDGPSLGHPHVILRGDIVERKVCLHLCPFCGWWVAEDRAILPAVQWQHWAVTLASASVFEQLALADISTPLHTVRRYLAKRFDARSSMHPRLFELTVASVFNDFGYVTQATAYTSDGGIDVVLMDGTGTRIGVQVKRWNGVIEVEQIRAFLGALVLGGYSRGVYVATSCFSRGARNAAVLSANCGMPIELVDADRFFDVLGYAQMQKPPTPEDCGIDSMLPLKFHQHDFYHLKTL